MLPKINKMLPNFHESISDCPSIIVASMCSIFSVESGNNLQIKPKVRTNISNEGKCVKMKR